MKKNLVSVILVITSVLLTSNVRGQQNTDPPDNLPDRLPIGSRQEMLEWIVTNRAFIGTCRIYFHTNVSSGYTNNMARTFSNLIFDSYEAFRQHAVTEGARLYKMYESYMDPRTDVEFSVGVFHLGSLLDEIYARTNLGPMSLISSNSFWKFEPKIIRVVIPLSELQSLNIHVDTNPQYSYMWSSASPSTQPDPPYPPEPTRIGHLILNEWYSIGEYRARFTITADGISRTYTQHGDPVGPAILGLKSDGLHVNMAKGSDTLVEQTSDFVHWTTVTNLNWSLATNHWNKVVERNQPQMFFRARSD